MPLEMFPETRLRPPRLPSHAPSPVDPGVVWTPLTLGLASVPVASVPMKTPLNCMPSVPSGAKTAMPPPLNPPIAMPAMFEAELPISMPLTGPAPDPSSSIRMTALLPVVAVLRLAPGCEYPSIDMLLQVSRGSALVRWIGFGPTGSTGRLNVIVWPLQLLLTKLIASRRDPGPESLVLVTTTAELVLKR